MRKTWRKGLQFLLTVGVALSSFGINVTAKDSTINFSGKTDEHTSLIGLKGSFDTLPNGYSINKVNGDNVNISDVRAKEFELESNVTFVEGNNATFIFGAEHNESTSNIGKFFGIELSRTNDNNDIRVKLFQNPLGAGLGDNVVPTTVVTNVENKDDPINFKVSVDKDNQMNVYVNDIKANLVFEKDFKNHYFGGYFGFLTYNTKAIFDNFKLRTVTEEAPNFVTNLDNLHGLQGTWEETSDGLYSIGQGDNFATSDTSATNFEFSANMTNKSNKGAGALVFRSKDNPKDGSYVMNIDYSNKIFKLFSFPTGGTIKEVPLSNISPKEDGSYDLKVQAVGDVIRVFVNDMGIINLKNTLFSSGKLGLLTWDGCVVYQDVNYKELNTLEDIAEPELTDFEIMTPNVTITPSYDPDVSIYGMDIQPGIDTIVLKPSANGKMYVTKRDENGNVIKDKTEINGTFTLSKDEFVEDFMNVDITVVTKEGFSDTINFAVNRWLSNEELAKQEYRAQFHVTPQSNFMNDPNGMVYDSTDEYWHLFYQYSTKNNFHNQSWAHVRSKDLVNWEQQPLGLQIDDDGLIFSGSAVEDSDNRSGLFTDNKNGESKLVSLYTYHNPKNGQQSQALAYSKDHGVTWKKYGIIIPNSDSISGNDFRDPKVFKIDGDDRWYMVTAGGAAQIHVSNDLIHWEKSQPLTYKDGQQIYSECPMLYPAKVNGNGETKWVYGGSAGFYIVGSMKKDAVTGIYKWSAESDKLDVDSNANPWGGFGKYATMTFYEDGTGKNRQIGISWLQDFVDFNGRHYKGAQSLPQEYGLKQINGKYVITCNPVEEVNKLRDMDNILYKTKNKEVTKEDSNILKGVSGLRYDIEAEFRVESAKEFGFKLRKGNAQEMIFKYNVNDEKMYLDTSNAGPHQSSGNYSYSLTPMKGNKIKLRIIVDQGAVEAFGNDGEANISTVTYMSNKNIGMEFFSDGSLTIDSMNIYDMKSMYTKKSGSETEETQLYLDAPTYVDVDETFEVNANIYPNKSSKGVDWSFDEGLTKVSNSETSIKLKANKAGTYNVRASSIDGLYTTSSDIRVAKPVFKTNADNWEVLSGNWKVDDTGMNANNLGAGDSFYMSDAIVASDKPFTIEGSILIKEGQAAGIAFGVQDKNNPGANWYCANIDTVTDGGIAKMFKNTNGQVWYVSKKLSEIPSRKADNKSYQLRIEYDGAGKLSYYVNDTLIGEQEDASFQGGYVGIQTYKANATFQNIHITAKDTINEVSETIKEFKYTIGIREDDVINDLPKTVKAKQINNIFVDAEIDWDVSSIEISKVGRYEIIGALKGSALTVRTNVIITANIKELSGLLDSLKKMDFTGYTDASVQALRNEMSRAETLIANDNTSQEEVNSCIFTLHDFISKLEKIKDDEIEQVPTPPTGDDVITKAPDTPIKGADTYDSTNMMGYLVLIVAAVFTGVIIVRKRKIINK